MFSCSFPFIINQCTVLFPVQLFEVCSAVAIKCWYWDKTTVHNFSGLSGSCSSKARRCSYNRILSTEPKILCVLSSHELLSTKMYYTSIYIFYLLFIIRQIQISKNYQNPTSTSRDTSKTIFYYFI